MAAPVFVNNGTAFTSSFNASATPSLPGSRVNGNLLVAFVNAGVTGSAHVFTWPAGWTPFGTAVSGTVGNSSMAYRYVDGAETAPVITWTGGSDDVVAVMQQYSGVVASDPIGNTHNTGPSGSNTTSITEAGITLQRNNSLVLLEVTSNSGGANAVVTAPTGMTQERLQSATGGTIDIWDASAVTTAGSASGSETAVLTLSCRYTAKTIEICSEAQITEVDIVASPTMGFSEAASIDEVGSLSATPAMGFSEALTFSNTQNLAAISDSVGFSMAAAVTPIRDFSAAAFLGFSEAVIMPRGSKQPVVCLMN